MGRFGEKASVEVDHTEVAAEFEGGAREGDGLESGDAVGNLRKRKLHVEIEAGLHDFADI